MLPIEVIGWFYTLASMVVLTGGVLIYVSLYRSPEPMRQAARRNLASDVLMFGIWVVGLAGGIGVIERKAWGLYTLEFFCYALVVLMSLSIYHRYRDVKRQTHQQQVNWLGALGGFAIVGIPIVLVAYLTIDTLRSEAVRASFAP